MSEAGTNESVQDTIQQVWRDESARLVGALTRMTRDVELAEDAEELEGVASVGGSAGGRSGLQGELRVEG